MIERIIERIAARLPRKVIGGECFKERGPLMIRYLLLRTPLFSVYLHNFLRSDNDRHCHDHPWSFLSLILTGSYVEHTLTATKLYRAGAIRYRPAEWLHWVEVARPMWTLIVVSRKRREWGFLTERGWLPWERYEYEIPGGCD